MNRPAEIDDLIAGLEEMVRSRSQISMERLRFQVEVEMNALARTPLETRAEVLVAIEEHTKAGD